MNEDFSKMKPMKKYILFSLLAVAGFGIGFFTKSHQTPDTKYYPLQAVSQPTAQAFSGNAGGSCGN